MVLEVPKGLREIVLLTSNRGKAEEFREKLSRYNIRIDVANWGYPEIQADSHEDVIKFAAPYIAWDMIQHGVSSVLYDDSGLWIKALNGFPGIYTSHALKTIGLKGILNLLENCPKEEERTAEFRCCLGFLTQCPALPEHIACKTAGIPVFPIPPAAYCGSPSSHTLIRDNQKASIGGNAYSASSTVSTHSPLILYIFAASVRGRISIEIRGEKGFGFDPVFIPDDEPAGMMFGGRTYAELPMDVKNAASHRGKAVKLFMDFIKEVASTNPCRGF
ncbi:MAG: non-canonical purine NTP pyrophosphatase [Thermoplasmata archaeon]